MTQLFTRFTLFAVFAVALLVVSSMNGYAGTQARIEASKLPVSTVNDPYMHENQPITYYSFQDLDDFLGRADFRRWNDVDKVCQSMQIMFGRVSPHCTQVQPAAYYSAQLPCMATARAYIDFQILPPSQPIDDPRVVVLVDPVYPPWAPANDGWYCPVGADCLR